MKKAVVGITLGMLLMVLGGLLVVQSQSGTLPEKEVIRMQKTSRQSPSGPSRVYSYNAQINSIVTLGGYKDDKWILSNKSALFLPTSSNPAQGGNTILYAHNRKNLFGNLKYLKNGDYVMVENERNDTFVYRVYEREEIKPTETEKINTNSSNTLTLFTCDGPFDQKRLVVKAKMVQSIWNTTRKSSPAEV